MAKRALLGRKMHRPSTIDRLPEEIVEQINQLRVKHKRSIDEIMQHLVAMGVEDVPSRSALGRHVRSLAEVGEEMRQAQLYADALFPGGAGADASSLSAMNNQLAQAGLFRLLTAMKGGQPVTFDAETLMIITRGIDFLSSSRKKDVDIDAAREKRADEKAQRKVMQAVKAVASTKGSGLSKATVDAIYAKVLGVE